MLTSYQALHEQVKQSAPKIVALVAAADPVLIEAASRAQSEGLARFILLGNARKIESLIPPGGQDFHIVQCDDPAQEAIQQVRQGKADLLMKGDIQTSQLLKAVLDKHTGLRQGELLNHIAVLESPHYHKLLFISDGGINLHLDEKVFIQMVKNINTYLKRLGLPEPNYGMMGLVEAVSDRIPETVIAEQVVRTLESSISIEGPIAPDVALSQAAARKKGINSKIAGEIDVMLMPNTTAANHLVKGLSALGGCRVGGVIVGAKVPIILLSRSDDADTKFRSILLGLV